jgi:hypothetical protein
MRYTSSGQVEYAAFVGSGGFVSRSMSTPLSAVLPELQKLGIVK